MATSGFQKWEKYFSGTGLATVKMVVTKNVSIWQYGSPKSLTELKANNGNFSGGINLLGNFELLADQTIHVIRSLEFDPMLRIAFEHEGRLLFAKIHINHVSKSNAAPNQRLQPANFHLAGGNWNLNEFAHLLEIEIRKLPWISQIESDLLCALVRHSTHPNEVSTKSEIEKSLDEVGNAFLGKIQVDFGELLSPLLIVNSENYHSAVVSFPLEQNYSAYDFSIKLADSVNKYSVKSGKGSSNTYKPAFLLQAIELHKDNEFHQFLEIIDKSSVTEGSYSALKEIRPDCLVYQSTREKNLRIQELANDEILAKRIFKRVIESKNYASDLNFGSKTALTWLCDRVLVDESVGWHDQIQSDFAQALDRHEETIVLFDFDALNPTPRVRALNSKMIKDKTLTFSLRSKNSKNRSADRLGFQQKMTF